MLKSITLILGLVAAATAFPRLTPPFSTNTSDPEGAFDQGLYFPIGRSTLTLGLVTLPFDFLAKNFNLTMPATCQVCNYDCLTVHNRYGGQIALNPVQPSRYTCVCDNNRPQNQTVTSSAERCGTLNATVDGYTDADLINGVLLIREALLQCRPNLDGSIDSAGCNVDCKTNHQYSSGVCGYQNAVPTTPQQSQATNPNKLFCICS